LDGGSVTIFKPIAEAKAVETRQTDTAIFLSTHLAAALAGTSPACVRVMAMAMATKIIGDAEPLFDMLATVASK
jgi:hypothetical protein